MNSDSRRLSDSWENCPLIHQFTMRITLCCNLSQSVLSIYRCVQHDMLKTKKGSGKLGWNQTLIWVWALILIRVSCTSRQTQISHHALQSTPKDPLHHGGAQTGRKTTKTLQRVSNQKEQSRQCGHKDKLDILPTLSRDWHNSNEVTVLSVWQWLWKDVHLDTPSHNGVVRWDTLSTKLWTHPSSICSLQRRTPAVCRTGALPRAVVSGVALCWFH